ncbi:NAD(P)-binding domain-containing protein, partial [Shewanella algae]|uniref:NAD(P)-binding domain-containing protein n=1 Tax=Shewanella algae TaxID=38313 RepID=UPI003CC7A7A0
MGTGNLGFALGSAFKRAGHQVTYGAKEPKGESETSVRDVFSECEVVLLAVPFDAIPDVVNSANPRPGLIVVDCANPVSHDFTGLS